MRAEEAIESGRSRIRTNSGCISPAPRLSLSRCRSWPVVAVVCRPTRTGDLGL